jgi:hypothetical protein
MAEIRKIEKQVGFKRARLLRFAFPPYGLVVYDGDPDDAAVHVPNPNALVMNLIDDCRDDAVYRPAENDTLAVPHEDQSEQQFRRSWRCPGY